MLESSHPAHVSILPAISCENLITSALLGEVVRYLIVVYSAWQCVGMEHMCVRVWSMNPPDYV